LRGSPRGYVPESLFLHPAWLAWKTTLGWSVIEADEGFVILHKTIGPSVSMAYALCPLSLLEGASELGDDLDYGAALERLSLRALPRLPGNCAFIRWDLEAPAWTDEDGAPLAVWLQELRMNASTRGRRLRKSSMEYRCPDTMVVDLSGGREAVLGRMDGRTRYSIRLADRRGTAVEQEGVEGLRDFHALHVETATRHGLAVYPESAFRDLFLASRAYGLSLKLYSARSEGECAASAIVARNEGEAWYLFAASSSDRRRAIGPSAILYRTLIDCAEAGDERMDLLGVGPEGKMDHPLARLTLFKSGFGGRRRLRAGAWDYVMDEEAHAAYASLEACGIN